MFATPKIRPRSIEENATKEKAQTLADLLSSKTQKQIAEERGVPYTKLRRESSTMLTRHASLLRKAGYGGLVAGVLGLLAVMLAGTASTAPIVARP